MKTDNKRFAACVLVFSQNETILQMIENCAKHVEKIYVAWSEKPYKYNLDSTETNQTSLEFIKQSPYINKIEFIIGNWDWEEDQRNACLEKARLDGFDYLIIQDADEFYTDEGYEKLKQDILDNPDVEVFKTYWINFWKQMDYILVNENGSFLHPNEGFCINLSYKHLKHTRARIVNATKIRFLTSAYCYHLGWAMDDTKMLVKLSTWSHAHQFNTKRWFALKWLYWTPKTKCLHPTFGYSWLKAIKYEIKELGELPTELIGYRLANKSLKPTFYILVNDFVYNLYFVLMAIKRKYFKIQLRKSK